MYIGLSREPAPEERNRHPRCNFGLMLALLASIGLWIGLWAALRAVL
jgi:hypothetical protein